MASDKKDFYGKTVADAIQAACKGMDVPQELLDIKVVETGSSGIFGLIRKKAHIRITVKDEIEELETSYSYSKRKTRKSKSVTVAADSKADTPKKAKEKTVEKDTNTQKLYSEEDCRLITDELNQVLELMEFPSTVNVRIDSQTVHCQIESDFEDELTGPRGKTIEALQYLFRKMIARKITERPRITIDVGNYRERRLEELKEKASELGDKVKKDGKTRVIPSLNPSERRIVHLELQGESGVKSRSVGEGPFKKVLIFKPGRKKRSSGRGRGNVRSGRRSSSRKKKND